MILVIAISFEVKRGNGIHSQGRNEEEGQMEPKDDPDQVRWKEHRIDFPWHLCLVLFIALNNGCSSTRRQILLSEYTGDIDAQWGVSLIAVHGAHMILL